MNFNPNDERAMFCLMKEYGDFNKSYSGQNQNGEDIRIHIARDNIIVDTYQENGWVRRNVYTKDKQSIIREEMFPERWK